VVPAVLLVKAPILRDVVQRRYTCDHAPHGPQNGCRRSEPLRLLIVYMSRIDEESMKSSPPRRIRSVLVPVGVSVLALVG
jgi:hypothetical protein